MNNTVEKKKGGKILDVIETVGNKLPHPYIMFLWLCLILAGVSTVCSLAGVQVINPTTGETVLQPAFDYVVPALFGGLVAQTVIKGKKEIFHYLIPLAVCLFFCYCTKVASAYYMLIVIAVSAAVAVMDYLKTEKKEERGE